MHIGAALDKSRSNALCSEKNHEGPTKLFALTRMWILSSHWLIPHARGCHSPANRAVPTFLAQVFSLPGNFHKPPVNSACSRVAYLSSGPLDGRHGFHAGSQLPTRTPMDVEVPFLKRLGWWRNWCGICNPNPDTSSPIADEAIANFRAESGIEPPGPGTHDRFSENMLPVAVG